MSELLRRHVSRIAALAVLAIVTLLLVNSPGAGYSSGELSSIASKYHFQQLNLTSASRAPHKSVYNVEPQLKKISAWASALGAAVALTDADADGVNNDVCLVDPRTSSVTVAPSPSTGARFTPFLLDARPLAYDRTMTPMGCAPGDFNEDGLTDFIGYYTGRSPVLFLRRPGTTLGPAGFVRQELVTPRKLWNSDTVTQADVDGDGHVDLLVGNYWPDNARLLDPSAPNPDPHFQMAASLSRAGNGGGLRIFLWQSARSGASPSARFREVRGKFSKGLDHGWTVAIGAADLKGTQQPDLYIANDFGHDHLLVNDSTPGHVRLSKVTGHRGFTTPASKVLGKDSFKSMAAAFGDLSGHGRLDIFVSNITTPYGLHESNFVWSNTGGRLRAGATAPFVERSEKFGMARSGWGWDAKIGDFDNDTRPEVVQATGFMKGPKNRWPELQELAMGNDHLTRHLNWWPSFKPGDDLSGHEHNAFYARGDGDRYANVANRVGLGKPMLSRGVALGDVNRDGRLDFALANQWGPSFLYLNGAARRPYLGLQLLLPPAGKTATTTKVLSSVPRGTLARPAIGATVTVQLPRGRRLIQQIDGGNGHAGASAPEVLFGLGDRAPSQVVANIAWRDGKGVAHHASYKLRPGWHALLLEG
ncbi:MAG TPA: CRTAC1 family protein [Thermoleophilaceae bacterium]